MALDSQTAHNQTAKFMPYDSYNNILKT